MVPLRLNADPRARDLERRVVAGDLDAAAQWVRERQRAGEEVSPRELIALGLAVGLEKLPYDEYGDHEIHTGHKAFDRQTRSISPGQVVSPTQFSNVIRAFNDLGDQGFRAQPGQFQEWDFHVFPWLDPFVRQFTYDQTATEPAILYQFRVASSGRMRDLGYVVARPNSQLLGVFARAHPKAQAVMEAVTPVVSWHLKPEYADLQPTGVCHSTPHHFDGTRSLSWNPGDEGIRRRERSLHEGASPEEKAAFSRARQRRGEDVAPWELFPVSYVFLEAYREFSSYYKPGGLRQPNEPIPNVTGRVEAHRLEAFRPWLPGPKATERFYVVPCSYPLAPPIGIREPGDGRSQEAHEHLRSIEEWRERGAVVVELDMPYHDCDDPDVATCGNCERSWCDRCDPVAVSWGCHWCHGRGWSDAELPKFAASQRSVGEHYAGWLEWIRAYRWRVLVWEHELRRALSKSGVWSGWGSQQILIPEQWEWARVQKKVKKRWKNNPW